MEADLGRTVMLRDPSRTGPHHVLNRQAAAHAAPAPARPRPLARQCGCTCATATVRTAWRPGRTHPPRSHMAEPRSTGAEPGLLARQKTCQGQNATNRHPVTHEHTALPDRHGQPGIRRNRHASGTHGSPLPVLLRPGASPVAAYGPGEPVTFAQYAGTLACPPAAAISLRKAAECLRAPVLACA